MEFNFKNYNLFCYDFNLIPSRYKNLKIFKEYCNGNYKKIFKLINNEKYKILEIKPIRKIKRNRCFNNTFISSYCVIYEKMI